MTGKVVRFFSDRGYGFIKGDDNKIYFAHYSKIAFDTTGRKDLTLNERVEFDFIETQKGLMAVDIKRA